MKKYITILSLFVSASAIGQKVDESKVPANVRNNFREAYPNTEVKWEKEKGNYEASFSKDSKKMSVLIDTKGAILETETAIKVSDLSQNIIAYMSKNYKGEKIKEAAHIILADGTEEYEAAVKGLDVLFDKNGNFIKTAKD